jgi:hypothetical protein
VTPSATMLPPCIKLPGEKVKGKMRLQAGARPRLEGAAWPTTASRRNENQLCLQRVA